MYCPRQLKTGEIKHLFSREEGSILQSRLLLLSVT